MTSSESPYPRLTNSPKNAKSKWFLWTRTGCPPNSGPFPLQPQDPKTTAATDPSQSPLNQSSNLRAKLPQYRSSKLKFMSTHRKPALAMQDKPQRQRRSCRTPNLTRKENLGPGRPRTSNQHRPKIRILDLSMTGS